MATLHDLGRRRVRRKEERVAFVLSGGGNLGAVQVGMMRALLEHGVTPDLVVGCSVGALNGAALADEPTLVGVARLEQVWRTADGDEVMPRSWLPRAAALARKGEAVHDSDGLRQMFGDSIRAREFKDLAVPFQCVATDVDAAEEVWFDDGVLIDAVLASASLPAIFPAVEIDGRRYLDGAIVNDVPVSRAVELGATTLFVLQVGSFSRPRSEPRRPLDVAIQAYWIARHYRYKRDLRAVQAMPDVDVHVLPHGQPPVMRYNDFTRSPELIATAYDASVAYLDENVPVPASPPGTSRRRSLLRSSARLSRNEGGTPLASPAE